MDEKINNVITENVESREMIIPGKCGIRHDPRHVFFPDRLKVGKIVKFLVIDNASRIIEMETRMKRVGINDKPQEKNREKGKKGFNR